ncbi:PRKR-interacting protein 1 homolog [Amphibalanus amphitrite]|uniref:PRKR-interacting protein 1 homolog n=1 Tax=Amphibalanus amphitrite TaxID=1232801 RepID=UPI001C925F37|nr:PRKR-interacting protein 1 homolog [Amphibalanus amphitrite]XP_043201832.1 PRKR-interacting protein 1 homolog [Amphibalanus amphitrite]XP_043201833.1 PRKR-interacting protein 1 homolog [Amphibalanus amphitrite]
MDDKKNQGNKKDQEEKKPVKNAVDLQKLKLEKLFKNIEKPVHLPEPVKKRGFSAAPEFVRNVMGSSAGAGSGEFHVYRHIRRRENARLKYIAEEAAKEDKDEEYQRKLEENRKLSEQRTAKKRAKRQKKKARQQGREKRPKVAPASASAPAEGSESDDDESGSEPEPAEGDRVAEGQGEGEGGDTPVEQKNAERDEERTATVAGADVEHPRPAGSTEPGSDDPSAAVK